MVKDLFYQRLGLCMRAGKLVSGEDQVLRAVRNGEACLVVAAADASPNTRKRLTDKCGFYNVPLLWQEDREKISRAIGKEERVVMAVTDSSLAALLINAVDKNAGGDVDE